MWAYLQLVLHTQGRAAVWRRTQCFSLPRWARGSRQHQALTLKASLACHFLVLSKTWMIFLLTEHYIYHLHSTAGPRPGWVNIMYSCGGSSWRLRWIGLNGELGSDDDSVWANKKVCRLEVDAELHGGLPKHVNKDEVGETEKFENRKQWDQIKQ